MKAHEYYGATVNLKRIKKRKQNLVNKDPIIIENQHEAIVSKETFLECQEILKGRLPKLSIKREGLINDILIDANINKQFEFTYDIYHKEDTLKGRYRSKSSHISIPITEVHQVLKTYSIKRLNFYLKDKEAFKHKALNEKKKSIDFKKKQKIEEDLAKAQACYALTFEKQALNAIPEATINH